jgi:hypothetical protein
VIIDEPLNFYAGNGFELKRHLLRIVRIIGMIQSAVNIAGVRIMFLYEE